MSPTPAPASATNVVPPPHEDVQLKELIAWHLDEEVVISGVSGRLPESSNIEEFKKNLYSGVDMVTEDDRRFPAGSYGTFPRAGKIKDEDISKFDATFFGINAKQADQMDPQARLLLEVTYEAIADAGINPVTLRDSRTGVYVASSCHDALSYWTEKEELVTGYALTGCESSMLANRISFCMDFTGPSFALDTSCSSSMQALIQAVMEIRTGVVERAVVAGSNILYVPGQHLQFQKLHLLPSNNISTPFDDSSDGMTRSEGVVVFLLQKKKDAKRSYATVLGGVATSDGEKENGFLSVSCDNVKDTLNEALAECGVKAEDVVYVETHTVGTKVGDCAETNAFVDVLCKNREEPLPVGCVKSNMGHAEAASGLCSLLKVILAFETGLIAPNLHFDKPNKNIPALLENKMKVVTKPTPIKDGVVVVNAIGMANTVTTVLVKPTTDKPKRGPKEGENVNGRLVCISGRTKEAVDEELDMVIKNSDKEEFLAIVNDLHREPIPGFDQRGYAVKTNAIVKEIQLAAEPGRPIWFVFSGMGSQWAGMARDLYKIPICAASLDEIHNMLQKEVGFDLREVLFSENETTFDTIINAGTSITAIQVALIDLLTALGVHSDGMLGHSLGEVACAYADGTLDRRQAVLTTYYRAYSLTVSDISEGAMAAVGLSWEETKRRIPEGIYAACHNSVDSVTISGPPDKVKTFVEQLKSEGVFAREVKSTGFAFHSVYVAKAGSLYRKYLEKLITDPKPRTNRWISTSVPENEWSTEKAKYSDAEYHVSNMISPVLFEEGFKYVPENAIVIEIAPHHLMLPVLKRALSQKTTVLGLVKRNHPDNVEYILSNLGKAYLAGVQLELNSLLTTSVQYPVSHGTPMIQSMIGWDHSTDWTVPDFSKRVLPKTFGCDLIIDLTTDEYKYINHHYVDGRIIIPGAGFLVIAWNFFAKLNGRNYRTFPVVLENAEFFRATIMPEDGTVTLKGYYMADEGKIEISEGSAVIMRCNARPGGSYEEETLSKDSLPETHSIEDTIVLTDKQEIYKPYMLMGFKYSGPFTGINTFDVKNVYSSLEWHDCYGAFLDTLFQVLLFAPKIPPLHIPVGIRRAYMDPVMHEQIASAIPPGKGMPASYYKDIDCLRAGGIEVRGLSFNSIPARTAVQTPLYEQYTFVPYFHEEQKPEESTDFTPAHILRLYTHLVIENCPQAFDIKVMEYGENKKPESLHALQIMETIESVPLSKLEADVMIVTNNAEGMDPSFTQNGIKFANGITGKDYNFVVAENVAADSKMLNSFVDVLSPGGFILLQESPDASLNDFSDFNLQLISRIKTENSSYLFLRKPVAKSDALYISVDGSLKWVETLKSAIKSSTAQNEKVILVSQGEPNFGILGFVNCLKSEPGGSNLRCIFVQDDSAPKFSESNQFYESQLKKDLLMNVYKNGKWGSYRHLIIPSEKENKIVTPYAYVNTTICGDLSTLQWIEEAPPEYRLEYGNKRLCYVYYVGLAQDDVLMASLKGSKYVALSGIRLEDEDIGMEFSGRDTEGKRVMGLVNDRALATTVFADDDLLWEVPEDLTLQQASTVSLAYSTAYYALVVKGRIKSGETVLIDEAMLPLAQAAINISLKAGCKLLVTAKSDKFFYLSNLYPELTSEDMVDPSEVPVEYLIMKRTNFKGVDVIFSTIGSHQVRRYCHYLTKRGRFLDIRKPDTANPAVGTDFMEKDIVYYAIYPESFFAEGGISKEDKQKVAKLVNEGLKDGTVVPSITTPFAEIDKAFSFINEGNYFGKVCIEVKEEEDDDNDDKDMTLRPASIPASRRAYFDPNKSYIILGGLGGFGIELIRWMVTRHARNIIAVSRRGLRTPGHEFFAQVCKMLNANLIVSTADSSTLAGAEEIIKIAATLGPVGGIFNLAAVLKDSLFENSTVEIFEEVCKPKVEATHNMDVLSRKLCPELDYFVAFSSISCGRGNAGQTNYGMANSAMDRICEARVAAGYPAMSIQFGAIGDVGMILERTLMSNDTAAGGIIPQKLKSCLSTLDYFLGLKYPILATAVLEEKSKSLVENVQLKPTHIVANILGIKDVETINKNATLVELGTDSLTNVEIKQTLERKFDIVLSPQEILQLTFQKLEELS